MKRLEEYVHVGQKRLRCGYTTGTCAAAAARAAAELLFSGVSVPAVRIDTPAGVEVAVEVEAHDAGPGWAQCAVRKDAGDDPDVTDGALVAVHIERADAPGVRIEGGIGVGRITQPGLDQPVGAAAINSVPRRMIADQVAAAWEESLRRSRPDAGGAALRAEAAAEPRPGVRVTVSVPGGEELARKTFNARLGIVGGISIIGTSGIVKPMSEDALVAAIELELKVLAARGAREVLVVPGNYGRDFARNSLRLDVSSAVSCSNYFGDTIDAAARLGFRRMLIVGHLGKMAKLAAGIMNTHSRVADCRVEALAAHAALAGAAQSTVAAIMASATTDAALAAIAADGRLDATMESLMAAIGRKLAVRAGSSLQVEAIVFTKQHGLLGQTPGADGIAHAWESTAPR